MKIVIVPICIFAAGLLSGCDTNALFDSGKATSEGGVDNSGAVIKNRVESCPAQAPARCWYAEPGGAGNGDYGSPGSVNALIPKLSAGDYLFLFQGVYSEYSVQNGAEYIININKYVHFTDPQPTREDPVTIAGYQDEQVVIRGDLARECILVDGVSHVVFEHMIVEKCFSKGMRVGWDIPQTDIRLNNMEFRDIAYFDDSGFLYVHSYEQVIVENSVFHDYIPKPVTNQLGSYIKFYRAKDVTVRNNRFYGAGSGIYYKHGESAVLNGGFTKIYDNRFEDLSGHGVSTNQNRTEIFNNLFTSNDGVLIHQEDGSTPPFTQDVSIHNNTFVHSGIYLRSGSNDGSYMGATGLGAKYVKVTNNILENSIYSIWPYGSDEQYDEGVYLTSNDNCFFAPDSQIQFHYFSSSNFGEKGGSYNFSDWQDLGYDTDSMVSVPQLSADYEIPADHPCEPNGWLP
ncbi:right-handed parallel beta-helix repeat-containing protein [Reinekea sp. G2M2-21]|uniref:right-handed parallel beta-helix repeat-containing protein n=1 Tax=Reinekea sp. G2M2-21 TaxID=2788942 RepID=UPI0018AC7EA1|nr:right-handed parallel beta-helix repeat-containing protein [Reinekea sp. G2M2-21]